MIWLTWRQFRASAAAAAVPLAVLAVVLAVTGPDLARLYAASGMATCTADTCGQLSTKFLNDVSKLGNVLYLAGIGAMLVTPAIIGVFWGAPLITREIEARSLSLAWNQSVTRLRWLAVKLGLTGFVAMATAGLLSLMLTWWSSPLDSTLGVPWGKRLTLTRLSPLLFATRDITPVGYAAFALVLGVTAGILIRRTLPAMAATLGIFAAMQFAWATWIRAHLLSPLHATVALTATNIINVPIRNNIMTVQAVPTLGEQGAWILSGQVVSSAGQPFSGTATKACLGQNIPACQASIAQLHLHEVITYQPASRFWPLQWTEAATFVGLALMLALACTWRVRHYRDI